MPAPPDDILTKHYVDVLLPAARNGDRRAVAELLTRLETGRGATPYLMARLKPLLSGATVIGITGPPGAGKSTLVNEMIRSFRQRGQRLAVIAVDPSSPVSGGAILGDRVRMTSASGDDGAFIRSLSSRGMLGGLSPAAVRLVDGLDASGFDPIIIETVGTGQNEVDIAAIADVRVVLAAPGLGDGIQAMKAGLLEIADILVVNKADLPGANATLEQLKAAQSLARHGTVEPAPVLQTSSTSGDGVEALVTAILTHATGVLALTDKVERRRRRLRYSLASAAREALEHALAGNTLSLGAIDTLAQGDASMADAVKAILRRAAERLDD